MSTTTTLDGSRRFLDLSITDLVKGNYAYFDSMRNGFLYYNIDMETSTGLLTMQFNIPIADFDGTTVHSREKAMTFMRWIHKAKESGELVILSQEKIAQ